MTVIIVQTLIFLVLAVAIPIGGCLILTLINHNSKQILGNIWGAQSEIYMGGLGIVIHELSHLLMALIFGHHIDDFKLVIMPWNIYRQSPENRGALGYVNHSWNENNIYQNLGNAFIGTAPIWGCSLALIAITKYLVPSLYSGYIFFRSELTSQTKFTTIMQPFPAVLQHMSLPASPIGWLGLLVWIFLSINISVGGFDLSSADIKNARIALIEIYVVLAVILFALCYLGLANVVSYWLKKVVLWFTAIIVISLIWSVISNICCRICQLWKLR